MNKSALFTLLIIGIIVIIIYLIVYLSLIKFLKFTKDNIASINYAATNDLGCVESNNYCKYKDLNLDVPPFSQNLFKSFMVENSRDFYIMSYYCANLVAKLSYVLYDKRSNQKSDKDNDNKRSNKLEDYPIKDLDVINTYTYNESIICMFLRTKEGVSPTRFFIIFRGTKNLKEWEKDFEYPQTGFNLGKNSPQISFNFKPGQMDNLRQMGIVPYESSGYGEDTNNIQIHKGFMDIYNTFRDKLLSDIQSVKNGIKNDKDIYIYITGHSLGSALSSILSFDLAMLPNEEGDKEGIPFSISNITIASPRVGNMAFSSLFNSLKNISYYQWNNLCDIIPSLPVSVMPNGLNPYFYISLGNMENIHTFNKNLKSVGNNHQLPSYIDYINSLIN